SLGHPATAEIVLEGHTLPHVREEEGPFGEFPGYYGSKGDRPVVEFTAMTYRTNPIFQTIYLRKPPTENVYLTALPKAADLYRLAKEAAPEVKDVYLTPGGCGKYHAVLSIKKRHEGEAKSALLAVVASRIAVKQAIGVDTDIDIYAPPTWSGPSPRGPSSTWTRSSSRACRTTSTRRCASAMMA